MSEESITPLTDYSSSQTHRLETPVFDEEKLLKPVVQALKNTAIEFAKLHGAQPWLIYALKQIHHIDGIVAEMRHIPEGQVFILNALEQLKPDMKWYRGGTLMQWKEVIGKQNREKYNDEQLNTYIIDHGKNGTFGRPRIAYNFLSYAHRANPVIYSISIQDLKTGLDKKAIKLRSEKDYDTLVVSGDDYAAYLDFCKNNLHIQKVDPNEKNFTQYLT